MQFENIELPSNRKFGFFFAAIFALAAVYFFNETTIFTKYFFGFLCLVTLLLSVVKPTTLAPFNKLWMQFGFLLGKIVSPTVLGIIFFILFTPIAVLMRLIGRDELRLKMVDRKTYWKKRTPIGPEPSSFKNQY